MTLNINVVLTFISLTLNCLLFLFFLLLYKKNIRIYSHLLFLFILFFTLIISLLTFLFNFYPYNIFINDIITRLIFIFSILDLFLFTIWINKIYHIFSIKYKIFISIFVSLYFFLLIFTDKMFTSQTIWFKNVVLIYRRSILNDLYLALIFLFVYIVPIIIILKKILKDNHSDNLIFYILFGNIFAIFGGMFDILDQNLKWNLPFMYNTGLTITFLIYSYGISKEFIHIFQEKIKITAIKDEIERAIKFHKNILEDKSIFENEKVLVTSILLPCERFSGDFYFYKYLKDKKERLVFCIGDVSGHGIKAALIMNTIYTLLKFCLYNFNTLLDYLNKINKYLITESNFDIFLITLFVGEIDFKENKLSYINASHPLPLIGNIYNKKVKYLEEYSKRALGIKDDINFYKINSVNFNKGDFLLLFTDGIIERKNKNAYNFFGYNNLINFVKNRINIIKDNFKIEEELLKLLKKYGNNSIFADDITTLKIVYK